MITMMAIRSSVMWEAVMRPGAVMNSPVIDSDVMSSDVMSSDVMNSDVMNSEAREKNYRCRQDVARLKRSGHAFRKCVKKDARFKAFATIKAYG